MMTLPFLLFATLGQVAPVPPAVPAPDHPAMAVAAPRLAVVPHVPPVPAAPRAYRTAMPAGWLAQDPGDSLYRVGRTALSGADYREAARVFKALRDRYPRSGYTPDTYYWEAFARSRTGSVADLREAVRLLDEQQRRFADARTARDARGLAATIQGELARRGDSEAAQYLAEEAAKVAPPSPPTGPTPRVAPTPPTPPVGEARGRGRGRRDACDDETDERLMALTAIMNMRSEQALPILKQVLEKRDAGSVCLRRKAVFLVSQKRGAEVEDILLNSVRGDPDAEVREQAVFWLSQVNTERAVAALDSILQRSTDQTLQEKAIFALSQQRSARASQALRSFLERSDAPDDLKENVVFWLGQRNDEESHTYLRQHYGRTSSRAVKEKIIFSLAQQSRSQENARWLLDLVQNENENGDLRANALFWVGQMRVVDVAQLGQLYNRFQGREMKEKLVFALSQRREPEAVDALINIARTEQDTELRKKAIFWLGQSRDPRAAEFLLELINR